MANKPSTIGLDGEHVDCYVGNDKTAEFVYVINQHDPGTGELDEQKCMLDFPSAETAKEAYLAHIPAEWFHSMTILPVDEFIAKVKGTRENPGKITASDRLTREIAPHEKHHDFDGHAERQDSTQTAIRRILGGIKPTLIRNAAKRAAVLEPKHLDTMAMPFDKPLVGQLAKSLGIAHQYGYSQVYAERYRATGKPKTQAPARLDDKTDTAAAQDTPGLIAETAVSDLNNWVTARARGAHVDAYKQGVRDLDLEQAIIDDLNEGSDAALDKIAMEAARSAVAGGRWSAFQELAGEIASYARSEAMDQNTCGPCEEGDGDQWDSLDEIDWTPGMDCEGGDACRGQLIAIFADEDTVQT